MDGRCAGEVNVLSEAGYMVGIRESMDSKSCRCRLKVALHLESRMR